VGKTSCASISQPKTCADEIEKRVSDSYQQLTMSDASRSGLGIATKDEGKVVKEQIKLEVDMCRGGESKIGKWWKERRSRASLSQTDHNAYGICLFVFQCNILNKHCLSTLLRFYTRVVYMSNALQSCISPTHTL
jgi:hypothetical protein